MSSRSRQIGSKRGRGRVWKAPGDTLKPLRSGQVRCPGCGKGVALTSRGVIRAHRAPSGDPCAHRGGVEAVHLDVIPEVELRTLSGPARDERPKGEPSRLDVGTNCEDCGKWLPGERRLCGQCYLRHDQDRRRSIPTTPPSPVNTGLVSFQESK